MQCSVLICWALLVLVAADDGVGLTCCNPNEAPGSEGKRCCPEGHQCSPDGRSCIKTGIVMCNKTVGCPDQYTCCKTKDGGWACCPLPNAICCADFLHCCPAGQKCNPVDWSCEGDTYSTPWVEKVPPILLQDVQTGDVVCDSTSACPDGTTCCQIPGGGWSCCPAPHAVCCTDGLHCCPSGTTCDLEHGACLKSSSSTPMLRKIPAFAIKSPTEEKVDEENQELKGMRWCDAHTSCPSSTTCCFMSSTQTWGCCPLPQPESFPLTPLDVSENQPRLKDVPCDETTSCLDGETCCRTSATTWGCCPAPNAVCCSDMKHCCPHGYTCTDTGCLRWYK